MRAFSANTPEGEIFEALTENAEDTGWVRPLAGAGGLHESNIYFDGGAAEYYSISWKLKTSTVCRVDHHRFHVKFKYLPGACSADPSAMPVCAILHDRSNGTGATPYTAMHVLTS